MINECSLTYEELNEGFRYGNFLVDMYDGAVMRIGGKGIVRVDVPLEDKQKCCICYKDTMWFEINFLSPMCSPRCNDIAWNGFWAAQIKAGPCSCGNCEQLRSQ